MSDLTAPGFQVIGELRIANRHQCRFLPVKQARNDKEAKFDHMAKVGAKLSATGCTNGLRRKVDVFEGRGPRNH